jgi:hypothetical protein
MAKPTLTGPETQSRQPFEFSRITGFFGGGQGQNRTADTGIFRTMIARG